MVIHLESISRTNLWQYRNELGTVWRLMSAALQFRRFMASATSTEMCIEDFGAGDSSYLDASPYFRALRGFRRSTREYSFLEQELLTKGYRTLHFLSSPYSPSENTDTSDYVQINHPDTRLVCNLAERHLERARAEGRPFYLYLWDDSSHLAYPSPGKNSAESVAERLRRAYAMIDATLNRMLAALMRLNLWNDTIIIGFGDHGDEAWSHGLNRGYCHSIAPYSSLVWTPMFMHNPELFEPGITDRLAGMVDLKETILGMVFPDDSPRPRATPFAGINLFHESREFAFSQNMYTLQREYTDPERGMVKGYSVSDGNYRLVIHSGGGDPSNGGMELYCEQADPANSLNLLKFFRLGRDGMIRSFSPPQDAVASHFVHVFQPLRVESLIDAFNRLRPALREFIKEKEEWALREFHRLRDTPLPELTRDLLTYYKEVKGMDINYEEHLRANQRLRDNLARIEPQLFPMQAFERIRVPVHGREHA